MYDSRLRITRIGPLLAFLLPLHTWADPILQVAPPPPPAPPSATVNQLLQEDARRALAQEQRRSIEMGFSADSLAPLAGPHAADRGMPSSTAAPRPAAASSVRLLAIVGVGNQLRAHVDAHGQRLTYQSGRASPLVGDGAGMRLMRIAPPCVHLASADGAPVQACLQGNDQ